MAKTPDLLEQVRLALAAVPQVVEKAMFGGITFMVNGKMCISVNAQRLMVRFDPKLHDQVIQKTGCRAVLMKGREYVGYVYVDEPGWRSPEDFIAWVSLARDFNKLAKAAKKTKGKP